VINLWSLMPSSDITTVVFLNFGKFQFQISFEAWDFSMKIWKRVTSFLQELQRYKIKSIEKLPPIVMVVKNDKILHYAKTKFRYCKTMFQSCTNIFFLSKILKLLKIALC